MDNEKTITVPTIIGNHRNSNVGAVVECDGVAFGSLVGALLASKPGSVVRLLESVRLDEPFAIEHDLDLDPGSNVLALSDLFSVEMGCKAAFHSGYLCRGSGSSGGILVKDCSELELGKGLYVSCPQRYLRVKSGGGIVNDGAKILVTAGSTEPITGDETCGFALLDGAVVSCDGGRFVIDFGGDGISAGSLVGGTVLMGRYAADHTRRLA